MVATDVVSPGVLRVASSFPYAPWEYYNPSTSKNMAGFDYDLARAIGAKLGLKTVYTDQVFDSLILSVIGHKDDMTMGDMYDNPQREKTLSFVDYAHDGEALVVLHGNPSGITNLDSLAGKTVGCLKGGAEEVLLDALNKEFKSSGKQQMHLLVLQLDPDGLLAMLGGKSDAQLMDQSAAANLMKSSTGSKFEIITDPAAPNGYDPSTVGIGIAKANTQLVPAVQKALQALIADGAYQKIIGTYGLHAVTSAQTNQGGAETPQQWLATYKPAS
jgi:polar amino acid transport system substrate-binding protein